MGNEIPVDFRRIRIEEVVAIATRLHWLIREKSDDPYFYYFFYIGDDVPYKDGKYRAFLTFVPKKNGNQMIEQVQLSAFMYSTRLAAGEYPKEEVFAMQQFSKKISELDRALRSELPFHGREI